MQNKQIGRFQSRSSEPRKAISATNAERRTSACMCSPSNSTNPPEHEERSHPPMYLVTALFSGKTSYMLTKQDVKQVRDFSYGSETRRASSQCVVGLPQLSGTLGGST